MATDRRSSRDSAYRSQTGSATAASACRCDGPIIGATATSAPGGTPM